MYVAVHVPRKSAKHRHKNKRKHHRHHSDRNFNYGDYTNQENLDNTTTSHGSVQGSHSDIHGFQGNELVNEKTFSSLTPQGSTGFLPTHKVLQSTASDVTPNCSRRNSLNGRPRYTKSHSVPQKANDFNIPEIVRGEKI